MAKIQNIDRLQSKLEKLADKYHDSGKISVVVGYAANYAIYVHERQAKHSPGKQWKFLEQPARQLSSTMGGTVSQAMAGGTKMLQALYLAGLRLQRDSQAIVPIDTGNLRGSAFTAKEDDLESAVATAAAAGAKIKGKELGRRSKVAAIKAKKVQRQRVKHKKIMAWAKKKRAAIKKKYRRK